jgi:drug/metabolite transporter (DMT)-like permease
VNDPVHRKAVGFLLLTALGWSMAGVLFKLVDWPPLAAGGGRGLVSALFLLAVCGRNLHFTWSPVQVGAAVAYAGCTVTFAMANKLTTAANAILLQYTAPMWIALFGAWLLKERPTRADWAAIVASFFGMALFLYEGLKFNNLTGILLALFSGLSFAATIMLFRKQKERSAVESVILGNLIGFVVSTPAMWSAGLPSPSTAGVLVFLGVVQLGIPYILYTRAIQHVTALEASLIPVLEPILNPIWVMLFVGERPTPLSLVGGVIVVGAVTWRAIDSIRSKRAPA